MTDDSINKWWVDIDEDALDRFINQWFAEIDTYDENNHPVGVDVVLMNFLASDDFQWLFIKRAFALAYDANHLEALAAGPVEHLLAHHGEKWISLIEMESYEDKNFAWMMLGVWQNSMSQELWSRVQKIQESVGQQT
jgi:hypothetical protein